MTPNFYICLVLVQEMMGLSYFMLDQSRKESEYCMESAFNTYLVNIKYWWACPVVLMDFFSGHLIVLVYILIAK